MSRTALVVGGTGPTGVPIVNGLLRDGFHVTVLHTGRHPATFTGAVELLIGDARDAGDVERLLSGRLWDLAICTSGRLRLLADSLAHRVQRLIGITGQPVYAGTMKPTPEGSVPIPIGERAERQRAAANYTGRVADVEDYVLDLHQAGAFEAVVVRYPGVYGPRAPMSHEWAVVRRILDNRPFMLMPHDGITYFQRGYAENVAHLVLLASGSPAAAGQMFNAGDEQVLTARHVAEVITDELHSDMELIGLPAQWCTGAYPLAEKSSLLLDLSAARTVLGYRDIVGVEEATRRTARHLAMNPPIADDVRTAATGPFDYPFEDDLLERWAAARRVMTPGP